MTLRNVYSRNGYNRNYGSIDPSKYVIESTDLTDAWLRKHRSVDSMIKKQIDQDRYIVNLEALERSVSDSVINTLQAGSDQFAAATAADLSKYLSAVFGQGSTITNTSNAYWGKLKTHITNQFATEFARLPATILKQSIKYDD